MLPHDYYAPWSDEPHLHNRGEGRPYVEPSWQANAAGYQLPILSTIGRGPRGVGVTVGNVHLDDAYLSFDVISDETGEPVQHVGPIPTGQVDIREADGIMYITTNKVAEDGHGDAFVRRVTEEIELPKGKDGSLVYTYPNSLLRTADDVYYMDASELVYFDGSATGIMPDPKLYDFVIFKTHDGNDDDFLMFGDILNADDQESLVVVSHMNIPIANLVGEQGPAGEDGDNGISCYHSWDGTSLIVTSASGTSSANLKGSQGDPGKSAYQVAVDEGYEGTEQQWLASLKGDPGNPGQQGIQGPPGPRPDHLHMASMATATIDEFGAGTSHHKMLNVSLDIPYTEGSVVKAWVTVDNPQNSPLSDITDVNIFFTDDGFTYSVNWIGDQSATDFVAIYHIILLIDVANEQVTICDLAQYAKILGTDTPWETVPQNWGTTGLARGTIMEFDIGNSALVYQGSDLVLNDTPPSFTYGGIKYIVCGQDLYPGSSVAYDAVGNLLANEYFSVNDNVYVIRNIFLRNSQYNVVMAPLSWITWQQSQ